jgi:Right handed beta helix region
MFLASSMSRRALAVWLSVGLATIAAPLIAIAGDSGSVTILSGKRVARHGDEVVTVTAPLGHEHEAGVSQADEGSDEGSPGHVKDPIDPSPSPSPSASASADASVPPPPRVTECVGIHVDPGGGLAGAVSKAAEGATFCLGAGTYTTSSAIDVKDAQKFVGVGNAQTFVTARGAPAVFDAKGTTGVLWQDIDISGAAGSQSCKPMCGRGISGGARSVVDGVHIHDNANAGIGGTEGNMLVVDSELDHNGSAAFVGCCAGGVKSANSYTIMNSSIHHNLGVGVWCDVGCDGGSFQVLGNHIFANIRGGVRFETSYGPALIKNNVVTDNNISSQGGHGGIEVNSSQNVTVERNTLGGNNGAGIIANGSRSPGLRNVDIVNNKLAGDKLAGCGGSVVCANNHS